MAKATDYSTISTGLGISLRPESPDSPASSLTPSCSASQTGRRVPAPTGSLNAAITPEALDDNLSADTTSLCNGTIIGTGSTPARNAADLKFILGNANSRLKPNASVPAINGQTLPNREAKLLLEQARHRARVQLDLMLDSNICVQGGYLQGQLRVHIRESLKDLPIKLSRGKVRVIGFECVLKDSQRFIFYQHSSPLSSVASNDGSIFQSDFDADGFALAREGTHNISFALYLPLTREHGNPKGSYNDQPGVSVRYIAMVSYRVKESGTGRTTVAHFYRNIDVWPRLDPSIILAPAPRPLVSTNAKSLFLGGSGKVKLTAVLHRLNWFAGQQCFVRINVVNDTKKTIRQLNLELLRSTVVFKPHPLQDGHSSGKKQSADHDAYLSSTTVKHVADTTLVMGQPGSKGYASAKGWWRGVIPGETRDFSYPILIPPDALSITKGRLLEVEYSLRVSLGSGTFLATDLHATLPIRIFNLLSVDPPPSLPLTAYRTSSSTSVPQRTDILITARTCTDSEAVSIPQSTYKTTSRLSSSSDDESRALDPTTSAQVDLLTLQEQHLFDESDHEVDQYENDIEDRRNLDVLSFQDDADDVVEHVLTSATMDADYEEHAPCFSDLYYASLQENLDKGHLSTSQSAKLSGLDHPKETSSFAARVEMKLQHADMQSRIGPSNSSVFEATNYERSLDANNVIVSSKTSDPGDSRTCTSRGNSKSEATVLSGSKSSYFTANPAESNRFNHTTDNFPEQDTTFQPEIHYCIGTQSSNSNSTLTRTKLHLMPPGHPGISGSSTPPRVVVEVPGFRAGRPRGDITCLSCKEISGAISTSAILSEGTDTSAPDVKEASAACLGVGNIATIVIPVRPKLPDAVGSGSSVKDRIRELEDRAKNLC